MSYVLIKRKVRRGFRRGTQRFFLCVPMRRPLRPLRFKSPGKKNKTRERTLLGRDSPLLIHPLCVASNRSLQLHPEALDISFLSPGLRNRRFECKQRISFLGFVFHVHRHAEACPTFMRAALRPPASSTNPSRRRRACRCSI